MFFTSLLKMWLIILPKDGITPTPLKNNALLFELFGHIETFVD